MRVIANLSSMFQKVELLKRYEKAASLGFRYIEVSFPYSVPAEKLRDEAASFGLQHVLINAPTGDLAKGFRGISCLAEHKKDFVASLETAVHYANTLGCKKIHVMAGIGQFDSESRKLYVDNVRLASQRFAKEGITCLIEPINPLTIPGYFLNNYTDAVEILSEISEPNLKIMFDVFHAQQICGKLAHTIAALSPHIGHVQVAQVPDRNEPDADGEINYDFVFRTLRKHGDWDIGCEYNETSSTSDALSWVFKFGMYLGDTEPLTKYSLEHL